MSERAPYSRVYWSIVDDPKFAEVYDTDGALATWLRLLIIADQAWPASASLPASAKRRTVELLTRVGLIDTQPGWRYRIHGLDAERERRKAAATRNRGEDVDPPAPQLGPKRDPNGPGMPGLSLAEPRRDETRRAETSAGDPADDYWILTGKYPSGTVLEWIDALTGEFGASAVTGAIAECHRLDTSTKTLLGRAQDVLRRDTRKLDRQEKATELARIEANRPPKGVNIPLLIARHNGGQHADDADPACPACRRRTAA